MRAASWVFSAATEKQMPGTANALIVTGSARGIGAATARLAAARGYAVCINYLSQRERAETLAAEIAGKGGRAIVVQADTAVEGDVLRLFETVDRELGPLAGLVNNAGAGQPAGRLEDISFEVLRRTIDVNLIGAMLCAREAVRRLSTKHGGQGGAIVNVSSTAGTRGGANRYLAYAAAKAGLNTFTLGLAQEVAAEGIRVNAVAPGPIDTELLAGGGRRQELLALVPMQRLGRPEEIAEAILWLLSGEAAYMIGAVLPISGGR